MTSTARVMRYARAGGPEVLAMETVALPDGVRAEAVTFGAGWYAVVTDADTILIFDSATGALRQSVEIAPAQ